MRDSGRGDTLREATPAGLTIRQPGARRLRRCVLDDVRLLDVRTKAMQFTVGLKREGKSDHIVVEAEDALMAALKVKTRHPEARLTYVRPQNRRGDARHPVHTLDEERT
jgi:hypothetical protein